MGMHLATCRPATAVHAVKLSHVWACTAYRSAVKCWRLYDGSTYYATVLRLK